MISESRLCSKTKDRSAMGPESTRGPEEGPGTGEDYKTLLRDRISALHSVFAVARDQPREA